MNVFTPTPEQARAADPGRSVWVTANAGTGKTRVLADRVLRLLLDGANPESILCLTFTKAAAVEMTARIERDLAGWTVAGTTALAEDLRRLEGTVPDDQRLARARRLFAQVLDLPQGLPVMTIHSFCASLLRRFPLEAGIAPHFDQIDDRSAAELMTEARMWLLGAARAADPRLAHALDQLTAIMAEMSLSGLLSLILYRRSQIAPMIAHHGGAAGMEAGIDRHLGADPNQDVAGVIRRACGPADMDLEALRHAARTMSEEGSKTDKDTAQLILNWLGLEVDERVRSLSEYKRAFLTKEGEGKKRLVTKGLANIYPHHAESLLREQVRLLRLESQIAVQQTAQRSKALIRIADALIGHYTSLKERDAALDFDDLIEKTAQLLSTRESREWVLFKLDARLEHLLVDEAQDTSPSQWVIIESLLEEFASGQGAHDKPRTLFVVGDEKQSIYSFQGADLDNFRNVAGRIQSKIQPGNEVLARSFRTSAAPLELVDRVLEIDEVKAGLGGEDLPPHGTSRAQDWGEVVLWPLVPATLDEAAEEPWALPGAKRFAPTAEENLARHLAGEIESWLGGSTALAATGELPQPGDVLVLVSRRGRIQELIIRALKHRRIPVAGADRMQLSEHIAVQDLIALGHALLLPEDDLNLACLLKSPLLAVDEDALFRLANGRNGKTLYERFRELSAVPEYAGAYALFRHWLSRADFVPPYELYCEILNSGGREALLKRLGPDAAEPIEAFLSQALVYEEGHPASLQNFLHWLTLDDQTLKRDPETSRSEVRVMTVHGAKGLEAPFVILADSAAAPARHFNPLMLNTDAQLVLWRSKKAEQPPEVAQWAAREELRREQERARLLYVALTRAQDRLLIAGWKTRRKDDIAKSWYPWIETALERCDGIERGAEFEWSEGLPQRRLQRGSERPEVERKSLSAPCPAGLPEWAKTLPPERRRPVISNPSQGTQSEPPAPSPGHGRQFGIELHRLLHQLADCPPPERSNLMRRALAPMATELDTAELARQVENVLAMPELAPAFAPGSRAEQPIAGRIGEILVSGQIDRLAVTDEAVFLVDFKSNRKPPPDPMRTPKIYLRQMAAYGLLLRKIYPKKAVYCGLVWTAVPVLHRIPQVLLDAIDLADAA